MRIHTCINTRIYIHKAICQMRVRNIRPYLCMHICGYMQKGVSPLADNSYVTITKKKKQQKPKIEAKYYLTLSLCGIIHSHCIKLTAKFVRNSLER